MFALAVLSGMFVFSSFVISEIRGNDSDKNRKETPSQSVASKADENVAAYKNSGQNAKTTIRPVELDYWIVWKRQFAKSLNGSATFLMPGVPGC